jgi:hypothetical protein
MNRKPKEYLNDIEKYGDTFPISKKDIPKSTFNITGSYNNSIEYKPDIYLNYGNSNDIDIIYIEDISENKQFTKDLNSKSFKLHLSDTTLYIDFDTNYYYALLEFDTFEQFSYCHKYKELTIALLNEDKSDIINKWTTDVNLL